jgi:DDE superfamily endonuclease
VWSGATANDLHQAMTRIRLLAYVILDGTLIPIDRVHDHKPYYSGKHRRHGMNVQVIVDAAGRLVWASAALPGSAHDLTAARTHGIIAALTNTDVMTFAHKAYQGAGGSVRTPFKRHRYRPKLSRRQKAVNKAQARIRCRGERAVATLKTWKILTKLRCSPSRTTAMVQAILVLHHVENPTYQGGKTLGHADRPLVMSCRARTRHTYDGTRRGGRIRMT